MHPSSCSRSSPFHAYRNKHRVSNRDHAKSASRIAQPQRTPHKTHAHEALQKVEKLARNHRFVDGTPAVLHERIDKNEAVRLERVIGAVGLHAAADGAHHIQAPVPKKKTMTGRKKKERREDEMKTMMSKAKE